MSQPFPHDPYTATPTRPLVSHEFVPEVGDFVVKHNWEVPQRTAQINIGDDPNYDNLEILQAQIINERNSNKVRYETLGYPRRVTDGPPGPGSPATFPTVVEQRIIYEQLREFIDLETITKQLEATGGSLDPLSLIFHGSAYRQELTRWGPYHNLKTTYGTPNGFLTRIGYDTNRTTGTPVRKTRDVVYSAPNWTVGLPPGVAVSYEPVAEGIWIRTVTEMLWADGETPIGGASAFALFIYDTRIDFTFPSYVKPFDPFVDLIRTLNKRDRRTIFDVRIRTRRAYTANVWAEKRVSYHAARPAKPAVFEWRYVDWRHNGALWQIDLPNVIANETPIYAITLANDTFYQAYNEFVTMPGSSPVNTDQYLGQIGTKRLVDVDVVQLEDRIYRKTETYVVIE